MAAVTLYFDEFLSNIRPEPGQIAAYKAAHQELRKRLLADRDLKQHIVTTFLQGSYRRATLLRPAAGKRADVDVVVLTRFDNLQSTPQAVLNQFHVFAKRAYEDTREGKLKVQDRSVGIELAEVSLDLVPTAAPSQAQTVAVDPFLRSDSGIDDDDAEPLRKSASNATWKNEPLRIPDREAKKWEFTNPLQQIAWTTQKNSDSNGLFVNVVKIFKHWRRHSLATPDRPKGFPLERMVGDCYVESSNLAEGITRVFEQFVSRYEGSIDRREVPRLTDYGVPSANVMARVSVADFAALHRAVKQAARNARAALDSAETFDSAARWRHLFGEAFPLTPSGGGGGFTPRSGPSKPSGTGRFA